MLTGDDWIPLAAAFAAISMIVFALWWFVASIFGRSRAPRGAGTSDEDLETVAETRARAQASRGGFRGLVEGSGLNISPATAIAIMLLTGILFGGIAFIFQMDSNPFLAIPAFILGVCIPFVVFVVRRGQVRRVLREQLPDTLFLLARSLRAGRTLEQAFQFVGEQGVAPLSIEFARMYRQIDLGIPVDQVVHGTADRLRLVDFNIFASVVSLHRATGGNLPALLDRLAISTRDRIQFEGQLRSATVLGRYSTAMIGGMALVILIYLFFYQTNFDTRRFFDVSAGYTGITLLATAVGFELIGIALLFWMLRFDY